MNIYSDDEVEYGRSKLCRIVYAKRKSGAMPAKDFLEALDIGARIKYVRLLERMLQHGKITNTQKFKKLQGDSNLWEFISIPYRLFAFQYGKTWVLTNGFEKRKGGTDKKHIDKGVSIRKEYLEMLK